MQSCKNIIENYEIYLNDTSKNDITRNMGHFGPALVVSG
jgi:hypothetical protein